MIYAVADLHGQYELWKQIQDYLKPEDKLIIAGDCVDRGPKGFTILMEALQDPRCTVLKGNHEMMLQRYLETKDPQVWFWNGGKETLADMTANDADLNALKSLLEILPLWARVGKTIVCHAGFNPIEVDLDELDEDDFVWDRSHFYADWESAKGIDKIVFGHTPIPHLATELDRWKIPYENEGDIKLTFADGHKICIDAGAFATSHIGLLDLTTFEVKEFKI